MNSFIVSLYNFQVKDHFNSSHKGESFYAYSSANKCQTCYQGPFQYFPELLEHLAFNHPESIDKFKEDNFKSEEEKIGTKPPIKRRKKQQPKPKTDQERKAKSRALKQSTKFLICQMKNPALKIGSLTESWCDVIQFRPEKLVSYSSAQ